METPLTAYPAAPRLDVAETRHGLVIRDPYRWLEDERDPRTAGWVAAQEAVFAAESATWAGRDRWRARLARLTAVGAESVPLPRGKRVFSRRQRPGQDQPEVWVAEEGAERQLIGGPGVPLGDSEVLESWEPSLEGGLLAYQVSAGGREDSLLSILDVGAGRVVDGPIDRVRRSPVAWLPGGAEFYYVRRLPPPDAAAGEDRYHRRVCLHRVGADPATDQVVFGEGEGKTRFYTVAASADGRWLAVTATTGADPGADIWVADLAACDRRRPAFHPVRTGERTRARLRLPPGPACGDSAWLITREGAPRGRALAGTLPGARAGAWRELIPERPDAVLDDLAILDGPAPGRQVALAAWTSHAVAELSVHDAQDGRLLGTVPLPGRGVAGPLRVPPGGGSKAWFLYTDHLTPARPLCYDARAGRVSGPGAQAASRAGARRRRGVQVRQVVCASRDGTPVRMFVISPGGRPGRPRPALLTGYGGFGASMSPVYRPEAIAWAQSGGVFAAACLRGGGEEGAAWHEAGRGENKQNVFDDFDAAADCLVSAGWASPGRIGIMGSSNGGLLVGAALTQHPGKYAAAVCIAPLLDMARYERSGMGPSWRPEYGSADDPAQLRVLLSYSPYHHVRPGAGYPPVLFAVFDGDTRVDPAHARKMCAALQHASPSGGPVVFRLERGVGHGARAASRQAGLMADCLAFLGAHLGLEPAGRRR